MWIGMILPHRRLWPFHTRHSLQSFPRTGEFLVPYNWCPWRLLATRPPNGGDLGGYVQILLTEQRHCRQLMCGFVDSVNPYQSQQSLTYWSQSTMNHPIRMQEAQPVDCAQYLFVGGSREHRKYTVSLNVLAKLYRSILEFSAK